MINIRHRAKFLSYFTTIYIKLINVTYPDVSTRSNFLYFKRNLGRIKFGTYYEGWNFNSGNYLFTTDTK